MKQLNEQQVIEDYYNLRSCRAVSEKYGCSAEHIRRTLKRNGVDLTGWKTTPEYSLPKKKYSNGHTYQPVSYQRICKFCGAEFTAHNKRKVFCSKICKDRARHKLDINPYKKICVVCGKEFESYKAAAKCCSAECTEINRSISKNRNRKKRDSRYKYTWDEYIAKRRAEAEERKAQRAKLKNLWDLIQIIEEKVNKECIVCGRIYHSKYQGSRFCSEDCRRYYNNRHKDKRISKDKIIDKDITLKKLFKRDGGKCWICGGICDWNDKRISDTGYEYSGDFYPSKDHVIPVAKGGLESWDNVRLAHWKCNCLIKKDKLFPYLPMAEELAYSYKSHATPPKKTAQYTLDGELIKIWPSTGSIRRELGLNEKHIQSVCRGHKSNTGNAYGYHWEYLEET